MIGKFVFKETLGLFLPLIQHLIWLSKVTIQNPLCHLEYKIFTFHTLCKLSSVDLCVEIEGNEPKYKKEAVVLMKIYKIWKPLKVVPFSLPLFFFYKLYLEVALDLANAPLKNYGKPSEK